MNTVERYDQAFPMPGIFKGNCTWVESAPGMTLRTYIAAQALHGLMSDHQNQGSLYGDLADSAVKAADALIKRLNETQT